MRAKNILIFEREKIKTFIVVEWNVWNRWPKFIFKKKIETGHPDLNQEFSIKGIFLSKFLKYNNIKYHHCHYLNFKALLEIDIFIIRTKHYFFLLFSLFFILFSLLLLIRKYSDKKKVLAKWISISP